MRLGGTEVGFITSLAREHGGDRGQLTDGGDICKSSDVSLRPRTGNVIGYRSTSLLRSRRR